MKTAVFKARQFGRWIKYMKHDMNAELNDPRRKHANELLKAGDWSALLEHADAWLADQPSAHYPVFYRANALWRLKRWQESATAWQETKKLQSDWAELCDEYLEACAKEIQQEN